jgi:hypothetical protein
MSMLHNIYGDLQEALRFDYEVHLPRCKAVGYQKQTAGQAGTGVPPIHTHLDQSIYCLGIVVFIRLCKCDQACTLSNPPPPIRTRPFETFSRLSVSTLPLLLLQLVSVRVDQYHFTYQS